MTLEDIYFACPPGWHKLLDECLAIIPAEDVVQVKEKFGGLRFYFNCHQDKWERIDEIESQSFYICQECGEEGKKSAWGGWWTMTLCPKHGEEREKELGE